MEFIDHPVGAPGSSTFVTSDDAQLDGKDSYQFSDIETQK